MTNIRLELGIDAQKFVQQVMIHNETIEEQIAKGINQALDEITSNDHFVEMVKQSALEELNGIVRKAVFSYELRHKISKAIEDKIGEKIQEYAEKIAEQVAKGL